MKRFFPRRCTTLCTALLAFLATPASTAANTATIGVTALRCEQQLSPEGIDTPQPRLSWQVESASRNFRQSAYHIQVADSPEALSAGQANLWDSRRIDSEQSVLIPYRGTPLAAEKAYWWRVRVWDTKGKASAWSLPAHFSTGMLREREGFIPLAAWEGARWIALEADDQARICREGDAGKWKEGRLYFDREPAPYRLPLFRREFLVDDGLTRASIAICGLGQFELSLNGTKVGDHFLDPAWTKYDKSAQYLTFDITSSLHAGANVLGVMLGNGFYHTPKGRYLKLITSYGAPKMICKLCLQYRDGRREVICSDQQWRVTQSPLRFSSIYGGEDYDASAEEIGWKEAGFDASRWATPLTVPNTSAPALRAQLSEPLRYEETIATVRKFRAQNGHWVYDLGQNASGIVRIRTRAKQATPITLTPAELLHPDSSVNQKASGEPFYYTYTPKGGDAEACWQPQFTYYGFRYVEVAGAVPAGEANPQKLPEILSLTGVHTRGGGERVGTFNCSNPLFNRIHDLIDWSIRSNMASVLTDCPHREKLGWLEVTHLMGASIQYRYDLARLYAKQVVDMREAQYPNGMIPSIAPQYVTFSSDFRDSPEWGSAFIIIPWNLYQWYGDSEPLRANYDAMKRYMEYLASRAEQHILSYGLGDWYDIGPGFPGKSQLTSNGVTATAIYFQNARIMAQAAELLGRKADAKRYEALAEEIRTAFNETFFNKSTRQYDRNSQTDNAMALHLGLVEDSFRTQVLQNLLEDIRTRGNALTAGDIGYRYLLRALEEGGASETIFDMNSLYDVPGYGYQLSHGATCLTESWQAYKEVSNNHCMLGHLMEWLYSGVGGISQESGSVAYRRIVIRPQQAGDIRWANTSFRSPYGMIRCEWEAAPQAYSLRAEIPAGATARIYLPGSDPSVVTESGICLINHPDLSDGRAEGSFWVIEVGSGNYHFSIHTVK